MLILCRAATNKCLIPSNTNIAVLFTHEAGDQCHVGNHDTRLTQSLHPSILGQEIYDIYV